LLALLNRLLQHAARRLTPLFATAMSHAVLQRCYNGHDGSALLALCDVFDTDAKLESAFQHVRQTCSQRAVVAGV
jgi:hypothetical protein